MVSADPVHLLDRAREGDEAALGDLLVRYRNYLKLLAAIGIDKALRRKLDASDVVQDALLRAHRGFTQFRGHTEGEILGWLRRILASCLTDGVRHYRGTDRRRLDLELDVEQQLDNVSRLLNAGLIDRQSPSAVAVQREQGVQLANALAALPSPYRDAVVLRHLEGLPFSEIALRLGRTVDSVKKLWIRGLSQLRANWEGEP